MIPSAFLAFAALTGAHAATPASLADLKWQRRILLVSAPHAGDPQQQAQRRILDSWRAGAADRDLTLVELIGDMVTGVAQPADRIRQAYDLPKDRFAVALIGKDGRVAARFTRPVPAEELQALIDAMPMRRAGRR